MAIAHLEQLRDRGSSELGVEHGPDDMAPATGVNLDPLGGGKDAQAHIYRLAIGPPVPNRLVVVADQGSRLADQSVPSGAETPDTTSSPGSAQRRGLDRDRHDADRRVVRPAQLRAARCDHQQHADGQR